MYPTAPKTFRLHIGIFGRRNAGKSSILNALTGQYTSIVSDVPGTTTDPVEKPMELLPLGPVLFIDTAGIDDVGALGAERVARTRQVVDRTDLAVIVAAGPWTEFEEKLRAEFERRKAPVVAVFNKVDLAPAPEDIVRLLGKKCAAVLETSCATRQGLDDLRRALLKAAPEDFIGRPGLIADLVPRGECAVLVIPIDKEAPKGRIILPQVLCIRDLLDHGAMGMVTTDKSLASALAGLKKPPAIVVTDSQAFAQVAAIVPLEVPLTSFSILLARFQGDLAEMTRGAMAVKSLRPGDRVLIAEACTHHPIEDDIGTVKIPRWLDNFAGGKLRYEHVRGRDFPANLRDYRLVVHCGACMWNRRAVLSRILDCRAAGVPITNYGLAIAFALGILERALKPFPPAQEIFLRERKGAT